MRSLLSAQGATEYLVLLAVVLVIALLGVALLGFFPGTASDAQIQESRIYWQSATPIAITEWAAKPEDWNPPYSRVYLRVRNNGLYPIRLTKLLGNLNEQITQVIATSSISELYYLGPGEEKYFGTSGAGYFEVPLDRTIAFHQGTGSWGYALFGADTVCDGTGTGTLVMRNFGFEYVQYVENQQITKRQVGTKSLMIKCQPKGG